MSGEHFDLELTTPLPTDELLLVRDRTGKRTTVEDLLSSSSSGGASSAIAYSETPPTDRALWWQMADGLPVDFWLLRSGGVWVSSEVIRVSTYLHRVSGPVTLKYPLPGRDLWVDSFSIRGVTEQPFSTNQKWRVEMLFINSLNQQIPYYFLELEGLGGGEVFEMSEFVGESVPANEAFSLWHKIARIDSAPRVRDFTINTSIRRLWNAQS